MIKVFRLIGTLAVLFTLAAVLYVSYRLLREADVAIPSLYRPAPGSRLLISMDGFRFLRSEDGRVSWRMTARKADLYETREAQLKDVEIIFNSPDGKRVALVGEVARMDTRSGDASISHGAREVRIITSDGYLMTTSSLAWNAGERLVRTDDAFRVLGKDVYVEGKGFSADVDMRNMAVESNVKAVLQE